MKGKQTKTNVLMERELLLVKLTIVLVRRTIPGETLLIVSTVLTTKTLIVSTTKLIENEENYKKFEKNPQIISQKRK